MKIEFDDRFWKLEIDEIGVQQSRAISAYMGGMTLKDWELQLAKDITSETWLKAMECLHWLMLEQNGEKAEIGERDFPVLKFSRAAVAAWAQEEADSADEPADPTSSAAQPAAAARKPSRPRSGSGSPKAT